MTSHFKHLFHPTAGSPLFCTAAVNVLKQKTESMMGTSWHGMEILDWQGRYNAFAFYTFKVNRVVVECVLPPFTVHITFFTILVSLLLFYCQFFWFCSHRSSLFLYCNGSKLEFSVKMKTKKNYYWGEEKWRIMN